MGRGRDQEGGSSALTQPSDPGRIDEVSKHYVPVVQADRFSSLLFIGAAALSLLMPYSAWLVGDDGRNVLSALFLVLTIFRFAVSQLSRVFFLPKAERMRRKQLLTDAFGAPISADQTTLYYNNPIAPSYQRLGANIMENAFFGKEISSRMLGRKRLITGVYVVGWIIAFALRHNNLEVLTWVTQVVFSAEVFASWIKLEIFHGQCQSVYDQLYAHFLHRISENDPAAVPGVLDAFAAYESAKAATGVMLSSKIFVEMNSPLTEEWRKVRARLKIAGPETEATT